MSNTSNKNKYWSRLKFLLSSHAQTRRIHWPILNSYKTAGRANPSGLGDPKRPFLQRLLAPFKDRQNLTQSMVLFNSVEDYEAANNDQSPYGGKEYGVAGSPESVAVCQKFSDIHGGAGAIIQNSGLAAISRVLETFLTGDAPRILIPDNSYSPVIRKLKHMQQLNPRLTWDVYSSEADGAEVEALLSKAAAEGKPYNAVYMESPGSHDFKIADLQGITNAAREYGAVSIMDNSWAATNFKPLQSLGLDVVVQATTKYESGYGDAPSGIAIVRTEEHAKALQYTVRADGSGAVSPDLCNRLLHRVDSVEARVDLHFKTAQVFVNYLQKQPYVKTILAPFIDEPHNKTTYERFHQYFEGKGNGLFTIVFNNTVAPEKVTKLLDNFNIIRLTESWGAHVSAALPSHPERLKSAPLPSGEKLRVSAGLEDVRDLITDWEQAAALAFAKQDYSVQAPAAQKVLVYS